MKTRISTNWQWTLLLVLLLLPGSLHAVLERTVSGTAGDIVLKDAHTPFLSGDLHAARASLDSLLAIDPGNPVLWHNSGLLHEIAGDSLAIYHYKKSIETGLNAPYSHCKLGLLYTEKALETASPLDRFDLLSKGEEALRDGAELSRSDPIYLTSLAKNLMLQGKLDKAESFAGDAIAIGRPNPESWKVLSEIHLERGDTAAAFEALQNAYKRFSYASILRSLMDLCRETGKPDSAAIYAEEFLRYFPKESDSGDIRFFLSQRWPASLVPEAGKYEDIAFPGGATSFQPGKVLPLNLQLNYSVKWGFISIGTLQITLTDTLYHNEPAWKAVYIARTHPGLPFITVADTFTSIMNHELRYCHQIEMRVHESGRDEIEVYDNDYERGQLTIRQIHGDGHWEWRQMPLPPNAFDATSILWLAQQFVLAQRGGQAVTEISGGYEWTIIHRHGDDGNGEFAGRDYLLTKVEGVLKYSGLAGMTGDYIGWFQKEAPCWPLKAKFKIIIGYITIKLESFQPLAKP